MNDVTIEIGHRVKIKGYDGATYVVLEISNGTVLLRGPYGVTIEKPIGSVERYRAIKGQKKLAS